MFRALSSSTLLLALLVPIWGQKIPDDVNPVTLKQGLKYSILKRGTGRKVALGDKLHLRYTGWLEDGQVFENIGSEAAGQEVDLIPGRVSAGWVLGLPLMHEGDTFKFTLPPELGYGSRAKQNVPSNSTLLYQVELLKAEPGVTLPSFKALDRTRATKTSSGLFYDVLAEGSGAPPSLNEPVVLRYSLWNTEGIFVECQLRSADGPISFLPRTVHTPFFKEAMGLMKPGARYRFRAPPQLVFGQRAYGPFLPPDSETIWELELVDVIRFAMPAENELTATPSGLKYKVLREGSGRVPKATDKVRVHYAGWLANGTRFDSSYERGRAAEFPLNGVVKGWTEGVQLMKEGGARMLVIPPELGYGEKKQAKIPANSTLYFKIELLKILDK